MTSPFDQPPESEEESISIGHAIGDSLAGSTDPNLPALSADTVKLTPDEELLLVIFREHPGQALTPERLLELATQARAVQSASGSAGRRRALSQPEIEQLAYTLDRKLSMLRQGERIRAVSGVGYILWR
jgi:DNA-binding response OmpR family regulator